MNKKDYKEIGNILKLHNQPEYKGVMKSLREMLADYFEEKNKRCSCNKGVLKITSRGEQEHCYCDNCKDDYYRIATFNKRQFLIDCGVAK